MATKKNLPKSELNHRKNIKTAENLITRLYNTFVRKFALLSQLITINLDEKPFKFANFPSILRISNRYFDDFRKNMQVSIINGINASWSLSNNKNNELARAVFGDKIGKLSQQQYRRYFSTNLAARDAFINRTLQGMTLSDRVWKYTNQFKTEIELALDLGIRNGLGAAEMTRDLTMYLNNPNELFRRVRDEHGDLVLSKAAKEYHPGQGVYRSSFKNAKRLAATETNIAYRMADNARWQQMDFVVGVQVNLSNNHTLNGKPFTDICDELQGKYPKDFVFNGWHPNCRCFATPILKSEEEFFKGTNSHSSNEVDDVPNNFKNWVEENAEKLSRATTLPYFVEDNEKYITL